MKWLKSIFDELNVFAKNLIDEEKKNIEAVNSSKEADYQQLKLARKAAKANKNATNTTIKQALSKSSIAKKIQALQNPTPEQLAKILAAIEG